MVADRIIAVLAAVVAAVLTVAASASALINSI